MENIASLLGCIHFGMDIEIECCLEIVCLNFMINRRVRSITLSPKFLTKRIVKICEKKAEYYKLICILRLEKCPQLQFYKKSDYFIYMLIGDVPLYNYDEKTISSYFSTNNYIPFEPILLCSPKVDNLLKRGITLWTGGTWFAGCSSATTTDDSQRLGRVDEYAGMQTYDSLAMEHHEAHRFVVARDNKGNALSVAPGNRVHVDREFVARHAIHALRYCEVRDVDVEIYVARLAQPDLEPLAEYAKECLAKMSTPIPDILRNFYRVPSKIPTVLDEFTNQLPIRKHKQEILEKILKNKVTIISAATGSGKTTQVPQMIMEHAAQHHLPLRIYVTQPRRIAAKSIACRVAEERGEALGDVVGYTIRFEHRCSPNTILTFCTSAILIRMILTNDEATDDITHIIIDEVHEQKSNNDLLMALLKRHLKVTLEYEKALQEFQEQLRKWTTESSDATNDSRNQQRSELDGSNENISKTAPPIKPVKPRPLPRIIIMSATLNSQKLVDYFEVDNSTVVTVSGRIHDIDIFYLEEYILCCLDIRDVSNIYLNKLENSQEIYDAVADCVDTIRLHIFDSKNCQPTTTCSSAARCLSGPVVSSSSPCSTHGEALVAALKKSPVLVNYRSPASNATAAMICSCSSEYSDTLKHLLAMGADSTLRTNQGFTALDFALYYDNTECIELLTNPPAGQPSEQMKNRIKEISIEQVKFIEKNYWPHQETYIKNLIYYLHLNRPPGAILVFLPGYENINKLYKRIITEKLFYQSSRYQIFILHSQMMPSDHQKVFDRQLPGIRKIILATNIAETSITIDDVVYVVDFGHRKYKEYLYDKHVHLFRSTKNTLDSGQQRSGRAGRCTKGYCYKFFTKEDERSRKPSSKAEILNENNIDLLLLCKRLQLSSPDNRIDPVHHFLSTFLTPPDPEAVLANLHNLRLMGATDNVFGSLTPLGYVMSELPLDPNLSRMLLTSILLGCLSPTLTIVSCISADEPFFMKISNPWSDCSQEEKMRDQNIKIFLGDSSFSDHILYANVFEMWLEAKDKNEDIEFCKKYLLCSKKLRNICILRNDFLRKLRSMHFLADDEAMNCANRNSTCRSAIRAVVTVGCNPNIIRDKIHRVNDNHKYTFSVHSRSTFKPESLYGHYFAVNECIVFSRKTKFVKCLMCTEISFVCMCLFAGDFNIDFTIH